MQKSKIKITNYDVFENGRIKLSSILRYMQELAREDSDACGATYELLRSHNMVFVITKLALEFHGDIYDGDEIELSTMQPFHSGCYICKAIRCNQGRRNRNDCGNRLGSYEF